MLTCLSIIGVIFVTSSWMVGISYVDYLVARYQRAGVQEYRTTQRPLAIVQLLALPWGRGGWVASGLIVLGVTFVSALLHFGVLMLVSIAGSAIIIAILLSDWQQIQHQPVAEPGAPCAWLEGIHGEYAGRRFQLAQNGLTIGRGGSNMLPIRDLAVSRQHARICYAEGVWFIQDSGSDGGTFVNGHRERASRLNTGDQITIGTSKFVFYLKHP